MANITRHISHIKSKLTENGGPKLPAANQLLEGEIAVNYAKGYETLSIKNESGDVVTFSSDNATPWEKGSGTNSAVLKGGSNTASGNYSVAEGEYTVASGNSSHAEGVNTKASTYSHAEGHGAKANGTVSHAEGWSTEANGGNSHAEGEDTEANGTDSHAEGRDTKANGNFSHAEGWETKAINNSEHASGRFNISLSGSSSWGDSGNTLFSVGNGSSSFDTHNALEIRQNGDIYIVDVDNGSGDTYDTKGMIRLQDSLFTEDTELVISSALNDLNERKLDASAYTPTDLSDYYTKDEIDDKSEIVSESLNDLNKRVNYAIATAGSVDLSNYYTKNEVYAKSETSGATEIQGALNGKQNTLSAGTNISIANDVISVIGFSIDQEISSGTSASTNSVSTKAVFDVIKENEEIISSALNDLNSRIIALEEIISNMQQQNP